jgi:hypothetical protein
MSPSLEVHTRNVNFSPLCACETGCKYVFCCCNHFVSYALLLLLLFFLKKIYIYISRSDKKIKIILNILCFELLLF